MDGSIAKGFPSANPGLGFVSSSPQAPPGKPSFLAGSCRLRFCVQVIQAFAL